jgi:hypothetical protein
VGGQAHHDISVKLVQAFALDGQLATLVRGLPDGAGQPAQVGLLLGQLQAAVNSVLDLIPKSEQKTALVLSLGSN